MQDKLYFSSDYMEGCHPALLRALTESNPVSTPGYGFDPYCDDAKEKIRAAIGCPDAEIYFLVGGTQTNAMVIDSVLRPWQGVLSAQSGHVSVHEAGAIEWGGHKVLTLPHTNGKITAEAVKNAVDGYWADANCEHMVMPGMVYISQPTEYGTIYSKAELEAISNVCRDAKIPLYVDGARLAYALACPENDVTLPELAKLCDIFYIGGTKCGALFGEAVVMPKPGLIPHFFTMMKQHGALLAKGRLLGVQFGALFTDGLYEKLGEPAIRSAHRITEALQKKGWPLCYGSPTNQIFFLLDDAAIARLGEKVEYGFMEKADADHTIIRLCTCWSTTKENTDRLIRIIEEL